MILQAHRSVVAMIVVATLLFVACTSNKKTPAAATTSTSTTASTTTSTTTAADATTTTSSVATATTAAPTKSGPPRLVQIATFDQPLAMAFLPDEPATAFVAEKTGKIRVLRDGKAGATVVDLSGEISNGGEQGLLGIALSPDGVHLYADFTNKSGDTRVVEWKRAGDGVDESTRQQLLAVKQPFANHNGGQLVFGPDNALYVGLGDGGSGGDPDNRAQNPADLLGKLLRFGPTAGDPKPEVYALGLRNPWRFTFDRANGDLWIGDVGQNAWEEVDHVASPKAGMNFGWSLREGHAKFKGNAPAGAVEPVITYATGPSGTCAVVGGYRYRGSAVPSLAGQYLYTDECQGQIYAATGTGESWTSHALNLKTSNPASFGEDANGELYVLSLSGPIYRIEATP